MQEYLLLSRNALKALPDTTYRLKKLKVGAVLECPAHMQVLHTFPRFTPFHPRFPFSCCGLGVGRLQEQADVPVGRASQA